MQLEFTYPWVLLIWPVLAVALVGYTIWGQRRFAHEKKKKKLKSRMVGQMILRCMVLLCVVLALSGIHIRKSSKTTTTIFLVDMSDSLRGVTDEEVDFVREAIGQMSDNNQAGIVVFGGDARIEQFVSKKKAFTDVQSEVIRSATNIEQAVQTAMALFPNDSAKRLVLLTDGSENEGSLANLVTSFSGENIELKVVEYDSEIEQEVYVSNVELPTTIPEGSQFQVKVEVYATAATDATVSLYSGRTLKDQKNVHLQKGENQLVFSDEGVEDGLKSYRVTVEAEQDTVSVNNSYSAFTMVEAPPTLLLVEGTAGESVPFQAVLDACNYRYEVVTPSGVPAQIMDMLRYQSIILLDVYADDLRDGFLGILETYVKDYAGGVIAIGGEDSYALGNYRDTSLEEVLPVSMDLEGEKEIPKIAMTMVIDHSGSMSSPSTATTNASCLDVAKQAAISGLENLRSIDEVGVVAFDDTYDWAVPLQSATDIDSISDKISAIPEGGGTSIYPAVNAAAQALEASDAPIKHIILLTDGQDSYGSYDDLMNEMAVYGITLSTVAVGDGADTAMLQDLANRGGGRYYYSDAGNSLPRIFAQEVFLSSKSYLINEEFTPIIVNSHDIIRDVFTEGSPSLLGYIATSPKPSATVILESERQDPVLAVWQCGLGHTVAWTSDATNEWTGNFAGWDNYAKLWSNIIAWSVSNTDIGEDTLSIDQKASSAEITYGTQEYSADTHITAVITDENGNQQEVTLKATEPGIYKAEIPLTDVGVYSVNIRNQEGDELKKSVNTATAMQYSQEYRYAEVTNGLQTFLTQVSGRMITSVEEVFDTKLTGAVSRTSLTIWFMIAAVVLFLVDIVLRRLSVDWIYGIRAGFVGIGEFFRGSKKRKERRILDEIGGRGNDEKKDGGQEDAENSSDYVKRLRLANRKKKMNPENAGQPQVQGRPPMPGQAPVQGRPPMPEQAPKQGQPQRSATPGVIDTAALLQKKRDRDR